MSLPGLRARPPHRAMVVVLALATLGAGILTVAGSGCGSTADRTLTLTASKSSLVADGVDAIDLTIEAIEGGKAGTGAVIVTADMGDFNGEFRNNNIPLPLVGGKATLTYSCEVSKEPECAGTAKLQAQWKDAVALTKVTFPGGTRADAGWIIIPPSTTTASSGEVYLLGTLAEGSCSRQALAALNDPTHPIIGFDGCYEQNHQIAPNGDVYYQYIWSGTIFRFVRDGYERSTFDPKCWEFPSDFAKNDVVVPTPACPGSEDIGKDRPGTFLIAPDTGEIIYNCRSTGFWFDTSGKQLTQFAKEIIVALGKGGIALTNQGVIDASGKKAMLSGSGSFTVARSSGAGFRAIVNGKDAVELWAIAPDGVMTKEGTYPAPPPDYSSSAPRILAGDGTGYGTTYSGLADAVIRFPLLPAASSVAYTEKDVHTVDWCASPPMVWTKMHGSRLVTGP